MKKVLQLALVCFLAVFVSCSEEETLGTDLDVADQELAVDLSEYEGTSLGLYKGLFSTTDSANRGVVIIEVISENLAKAELSIVNGQTITYNGVPTRTVTGDLMVQFTSNNSSFEFVAAQDGSNPKINRAMLNDNPSLITSAKENTRGALTMNPGTWSGVSVNGTDISGTFSLMFNSQEAADGNTTDITSLMMFNGVDLGGSALSSQENCADDGVEQACDVSGTSDPASGFNLSWSGVHTSTIAADCSVVSGTWSGPNGASGSFVTDNVCDSADGDFITTAIPITPSPEGTGCATSAFTIDFTDYTDSGINTDPCGLTISTGADIFYTWTATTDALFFQVGTDIDDDIIVRDDAGVIIMCATGSSFGGSTLSGWAIGDDLIIQISSFDLTADFCLEEATIPSVPVNDLCENALPIACDETDSGNTLLASDETGATGNDVFYSFGNTGMLDQLVTVSLCGSSYDTRLRILDGCGGTQITQNDDNSAACGAGGNSQLDFVAEVGQSYIIVVEAFSTQSGAYEIAVTCEDIVPPPPTECGGQLIDSGGTTGNYSSNELITTTITAGAGETISLDFTVFDTEGGFDFMRFFDGADDTAPEITTSVNGAVADTNGYSGTSLQGDSIVSTGESITIVFDSDGSVTDVGYVADIVCAAGFTDTGLQTYLTAAERQALPEPTIEEQLEQKRIALEKYIRNN